MEIMMRLLRGALASVALLAAFSSEARAQDWWWGLTWNMAATADIPGSADFDGSFVDDFSFRGIGLEACLTDSRAAGTSSTKRRMKW
jgi:hypothetical protein